VPRKTREVQRAETRSRLVAEARAVFAEVGFHCASIEEITDRAGYSRGAFYSNFSSKEDLFLTVVESSTQARLEELREIFGRDPSLRVYATLVGEAEERVERGSRPFDPADDPWAYSFAEFTLHAARNPEWRTRLASLHSSIRATYAELVSEQASHLGFELTFPPDQLGSMQMALEMGLYLQQIIDPACVPGEFNMHFLEFVVRSMAALSTEGAAAQPDR